MKTLARDTSTDYLTICVSDGAGILARLHRKAPRSHSSLLVPMIDRVLKKARLGIRDIDLFCMGVGPGSFTGLRIGAATVKGFAYVLGRDIAAVPTFDAIAMNAKRQSGVICVVLDARKGKVYASFYRSDARGQVDRISPYLLITAEELLKKCGSYDNLYFMGDYAHRLSPLPPGASVCGPRWHPRADRIAEIGRRMASNGECVTAEKLEPMYLYSRECDITGK